MRFSRIFKLGKSQLELDFVNVDVHRDMQLFIDPFAISQRPDRFSQQCHGTLVSFFERVVNAIRSGRRQEARDLLQHLREPNETRLGFSRGRPRGAGIGKLQSEQILQALLKSSAVRTGFLTSLEESELMVEGLGRDKISDLTTNVLRGLLAEYTQEQCQLLNVPTHQVSVGAHYSVDHGAWISYYFNLPISGGRPVLLVPKAFVRAAPAYDYDDYYEHVVLSFLEAEHLRANTSLVHALKNGRHVVYKKDLRKVFPLTKERLFRFSREHPELLQNYRERLAELERHKTLEIDPEDEAAIAGALEEALRAIPPGSDTAETYHSLMVGIVEFVFFPDLLYPRKEQEIHQGRKRIDIVMENGARSGVLYRLHTVRKLPCAFVAFECKNYLTEVGNPEIDQLAGRFSPNRGRIGFLCCRVFEDRGRFVERCRDTLRDDRGLMLPMDDNTVHRWLGLIQNGERHRLEEEFAKLVDEVWLA